MPELAPNETAVLSVWELTRSIRALLEGEIGSIWVEGEISNHRKQASGHQYFTLKDDRSQLSCVLFRGNSNLLSGTALSDGQLVQVYGDVTVYESRGQYQMVVQLVQSKGVGALQARFEALKAKLAAEGLFDPARKKPLPAFPSTVGLVTSPTGAALQDMLNILKRRAPWLRIVLHPVRVQGQGASTEIVGAINEFNRRADVDLIVVARGGGSIEDLWEFNEEIVARAIAASDLPVVSAIGHEIDFTIADFAADLRAPTPSAAAELISPDTDELLRKLAVAGQFISRQFLERMADARNNLQRLTQGRLEREPRRRTLEEHQRLDHLGESLHATLRTALQAFRNRLQEKRCCLQLAGPRGSLALREHTIAALSEKLRHQLNSQRAQLGARLGATQGLLRVLGPQATLERGYTITSDEDGKIIRSGAEVLPGQTLITRLHDGPVRSTAKT